jgi:hypothetical protein
LCCCFSGLREIVSQHGLIALVAAFGIVWGRITEHGAELVADNAFGFSVV